MDVNIKYKRWGWGALIGLIIVILLAGLVIALTISSTPKPQAELNDGTNEGDVAQVDNPEQAAEEGQGEGQQTGDGQNAEAQSSGEQAAEGQAAQDQTEQSSTGVAAEMPKTGPVDTIWAVGGLAAVVYMAALNINMKRAMRK